MKFKFRVHNSITAFKMSNAIIEKIASIAIIFAGSLICGLIPAIPKFATIPRFFLSSILCYGGGILMATSLVQIFAEVSTVVALTGK